MKIAEIIYEAIEGPLYNKGLDALKQELDGWYQRIMQGVDQHTGKAEYQDQYDQLTQAIEASPDHQTSTQYYDKRDRLRDDQHQRELDLLYQNANPSFDGMLVKTFKETLEKVFRETAIAYMEEKFGAVEKYDPENPPDLLGGDVDKLNLGYLQYLSVHIDTEGTYKSGQPRRGGGYFTTHPSKNEFTDTWSQENVNWQTQMGQGIKLFAKPEDLLRAAKGVISHHSTTNYYGEAERPDGLRELLAKLLPLWVHEVTHLEQSIRLQRLGKHNYKYYWGMSHTPQAKPRPRYSPSGISNNRIRGGNRGFPSHLGGGETDHKDIDITEYIEYYGTVHEIEAYAAGAAAEIMHDIMPNIQSWNGDEYKQREINQAVDQTLQSIAAGYIPDSNSIERYQHYIKDTASKLLRLRKWKDERQLNKINIGARKAWVLFMNKMSKHLLSYKKPVRNYDVDPRYRLAYPTNRPTLPDGR